MLLNEMLGIRYPVIQGGMAHIATGAFAAAVSEAGGLGIIASGNRDAQWLKEQIDICRAGTDRPFGVNVMMMNPHLEEVAALVAEEGVPVITTGAGNPGKYIPEWKAAGCRVIPIASTVALARRLERSGADAIIVEGTEAGGHVGELTTMAAVPQIARAVSVPVIAAGGIASGDQLLAALSLGACGVQVGTCLLFAQECPIHENYRKAIQKAGDTDTVVTGRIAGGAPVRVVKNAMTRAFIQREREGASKDELEEMTLGALYRSVVEGDVKNGSIMAGQVVGMCSEILPAADILRRLEEEYTQALRKMRALPDSFQQL